MHSGPIRTFCDNSVLFKRRIKKKLTEKVTWNCHRSTFFTQWQILKIIFPKIFSKGLQPVFGTNAESSKRLKHLLFALCVRDSSKQAIRTPECHLFNNSFSSLVGPNQQKIEISHTVQWMSSSVKWINYKLMLIVKHFICNFFFKWRLFRIQLMFKCGIVILDPT